MLKEQRSRRCGPLSVGESEVQSPKINFDKKIKRQFHTPHIVRSKSDIKSFQFSQNIWCSSLMRQIYFFSSLSPSGAVTFFGQGGLKIVRSCQRLGGFAPQTSLSQTHVFKSRTLSRPILIDINCMPAHVTGIFSG